MSKKQQFYEVEEEDGSITRLPVPETHEIIRGGKAREDWGRALEQAQRDCTAVLARPIASDHEEE